MSKSIYKYIVEDIIVEYFKSNPASKGDRFYMIVENDEHRQGIISALKQCADPIIISDIYNISKSGMALAEESYDTIALSIDDNNPKMLIGSDESATEDYLTTMRNSIGLTGSPYENYCVLFILHNSSLSSLLTAGQDMEGIGGPLFVDNVVSRIKTDIERNITRDLEKIYLKRSLDGVADLISDGTCNIYDFASFLDILSKESVKGDYAQLEMFEDAHIYSPNFQPSDDEMTERVERNIRLFQRIKQALALDGEDRLNSLCKFLDERFARKVLNSKDNWKLIDLQEFIDSEDKHKSSEAIQLLDIRLGDSATNAQVINRFDGKWSKKSKNYIIICDPNRDEDVEIIVEFNKHIKPNANKYRISGSRIYIPIRDTLTTLAVGKGANQHDFYILRLKCNADLMRDIQDCFTISAKGIITVKVPEDRDILNFGRAERVITLNDCFGTWKWATDEQLAVDVAEAAEENDKLNLQIEFDDKTTKFILKLNQSKPIPPLRPDSYPQEIEYHGVPTDESPFGKVSDGENERPVIRDWRKFLEWEHLFIEEKTVFISSTQNSLTGQRQNESHDDIELPQSVRDSLAELYEYFSEKDTIPSLTPISSKLVELYERYHNAVLSSINGIPTNRAMTIAEYNLTKLGTVIEGNMVYMSPFHPLLVSYLLEYYSQSNGNFKANIYARELVSPFYLVPFLTIDNHEMRTYSDTHLSSIRNWLAYEPANNGPQERANDITTRMVEDKMDEFIKHFSYLFQDKDCPIVVSAIGFNDDTNFIKGIINFIISKYEKGVQRIEIHEYVDSIMNETFYEKLNRIDTIDGIAREIQSIGIQFDSKGEWDIQDIIRVLFTRVSFFKHSWEETNSEVYYSHIAFYQMDTGHEYIRPNTDNARTELALNGLISIPSTSRQNGAYHIGFGTKGVVDPDGFIHPMAMAMNNLYANEKNGCDNIYSKPTALCKKFMFKDSGLLDSIYKNSNWVTFLNPEVDIDFFFQQNLYIIHYTDQYSINAKYDSITVTKHVQLYRNMLRRPYQTFALMPEQFDQFNVRMINYFNCLNGSWMLGLVNKTEVQVREKMSIVAACVALRKFLQRNKEIIWIPVSLEEIMRVTGSIGLHLAGVFSKKELGAKGAMSDDLLYMGLETSSSTPKLYFYPIEVKCSKNTSMSGKAAIQVGQTWRQFNEHIFHGNDLTTKIYRTFFASQFLTSAEKLHANELISETDYGVIESHRYELLNLKWDVGGILPCPEMGVAAIMSFFGTASHAISTTLHDDIPVCEIHASEKECFEIIADPTSSAMDFLVNNAIEIDITTKRAIEDVPNQYFGFKLDDAYDEVGDVSDVPEDIEDDNDFEPLGYAESTKESHEHETSPTSPKSTKGTPPAAIDHTMRITLGLVKGQNRPIIFEPNNTTQVSHPNMGIIGTMGTGKTQAARSIVAQLAKEGKNNVGGHPVGILVFDYKGDYIDETFLETVNGQAFKTKFPFNPLKLVVNDKVEGMNLPRITADRIADSFAKAYGLGLKQQNNIKQAIIETYREAGITNDSSTWSIPVPTMDQVAEKYFETYDANDKAYALFDKLADYQIFTPSPTDSVSLFEWLDGVKVIDLTIYPEDTKRVIVSLILDLFYAEMRQLEASALDGHFRQLRAMVLVDEAHQFLKKDFSSLRNIISEGRMFGVGMILSTQNVGDFKTTKEDYAQFVLSWLIHHVNSISKSEVASIFGTSDTNTEAYQNFISKAKLFESICKIGQKVEGIRDLPFFELIQQDERFRSADTNDATI